MLLLTSGTEDVTPENNEEDTNNETDTVVMEFSAYQTSTQAEWHSSIINHYGCQPLLLY